MSFEDLQVNLFTIGDSTDINTWSNLPFFFSDGLLKNGVALQRVDLVPTGDPRYDMARFLRRQSSRIRRRLTGRKPPYDFCRDRLGWKLAQNRIRGAVRRFPDADLHVFLTFNFSSHRHSSVPVVHLCDITYEQLLEDTGRTPTADDRRWIDNEIENLRNARRVFATSRKCCDFIRDRYGLGHVRLFDYGINLNLDVREPADILLGRKWASHRLLCIGRGVHKRGIDILVDALALLNKRRPEPVELDLVGVMPHELPRADRHVTCHGYLDKGDPEQLRAYTRLLLDDTLFAMPMREGPPPGVVHEAALASTPVLISNIWNADEMVKHGETGLLVDDVTPETIAAAIDSLFADRPRWERMALRAHEHVAHRSWERTVRQFLSEALEPEV